MSSVNRRQPVAFYAQIAEDLECRIAQMQPGNILPSNSQLVEEYGASLTTVQKALDVLKRDGRIYGRQGAGTFVAEASATVAVPLPARLARGLGELAARSGTTREALLADLVTRAVAEGER